MEGGEGRVLCRVGSGAVSRCMIPRDGVFLRWSIIMFVVGVHIQDGV